jgi:pimeloyl-ACP methyl ester carboxylesterase
MNTPSFASRETNASHAQQSVSPSFLRSLIAAFLLFLGIGYLRAQETAAETPLPPNVETFTIKTTSSALREMPFFLRLPKGYQGQTPTRVLFLCPVHNGKGQNAITGNGQTRRLLEAADERGWLVLSVTFDQGKADVRNRRNFYYYPEAFSGKAVLDALAYVKRKYPAADTEALLLQGFSGGAQFVHRFAIWAPEKVVAVAVNSTSWFDPPKPNSCLPAWLVTIGESDRSYDNSLEFVEQLRKTGAVPLFRSFAGMVHEGSDGVDKLNAEFLKYYDDLTRPRLGQRRSLAATRLEPPMKSATMPFVGDAQDWRYVPQTAAAAEEIAEDSRVYLPSAPIARLWGKTTPE